MNISNATQPAEYRSERASTSCPVACSGERYCAVPTTACVCVVLAEVSVRARAMPKSITFTWPSSETMMLAGLMSRCAMPREWAKPSAVSSPSSQPRAVDTLTSPSPSRSFTVLPEMNSMTRNGHETSWSKPSGSSCSPVSNTVTMFGWCRAAALRASWWKRAWNRGSRARSRRIILTAIVRSSRRSVPR